MKSQTSINRRSRGSVMVLVVAVLGLLAVIGTVYILSSRAERNTAASMSAALNLNLARDAVNAQVQQVIGGAMVDGSATPQIGGFGVSGTRIAARNFDFPELGVTTFGKTDYNGNMRDEPWLAKDLHVQTTASVPSSDFTQLTAKLYDPAAGTYTAPLPTGYGTGMFNVVYDQTTTDATADKPVSPITNAYDAYVNLLPFSDASGIHYRFGVRILDTNRMANLNTGDPRDTDATNDATGTYFTSMRLAPDPANAPAYTGTNYYNSAVDSTTVQNFQYNTLGTGRVNSTTSTNAAFLSFSSPNWQKQMLSIEKAPDKFLTLFDLSDELELRSYGEFGTSYHIRPAAQGTGGASFAIFPGTLSVDGSGTSSTTPPTNNVVGNPRRKNYTTYSFSRETRPYADPPTVTSGVASPQFTLTYTAPALVPSNFSTDFNKAAVSAGAAVNADVWPTQSEPPSATLNANPRISISPPNFATFAPDTTSGQSINSPLKTNFDAIYNIATAATNLGTAMERIAGFRHDEACGFAANYMTSLWSGYTQDANVTTATAYYLPAGPSFVDSQGLCFRSSVGASASPTLIGVDFGSTHDLSTTGGTTNLFPGDIMVGYAAQPYILEIAAQSFNDGAGSVTITDMAVVLYNPYSIPLSMNGYHLTSQTTNFNIDLTHDDTPKPLYVPARGFLIITTDGSLAKGGAFLVTVPTAGNIVVAKYNPTNPFFNAAPNVGFTFSGDQITLRRNIIVRGGGSTLAVGVDRASYPPAAVGGAGFFVDPTLTNPTAYSASLTRADLTNANSMPTTPVAPAAINPPAAPGASQYLPLDRDIPAAAPSTAISPAPITNIADFNRIMRLCNVVDATGKPIAAAGATPAGLLSERFSGFGGGSDPTPNSPTSGPGTLSNKNEGILYFDFFPNPKLYATPAEYPLAINPSGTNGATVFPSPAYNTDSDCDLRAITLLDCLATVDRYSDFSIDIGNGNPDISKLRIPGRINVNTASGDVLRAIPNMTDQMVADILYYRTLVANGYGTVATPSAPLMAYVTAAGITSPRGFHSLAELLVPLATATGVINPDPTNGVISRDKAWASVYNLCTVSSDTFVVYGYLEAVRQNPNFTGFNNTTSWYVTGTPNVSDDPHAGAGPALIRVARRRWVAIMDRSFSNTTATASPRIVAIKDLPY